MNVDVFNQSVLKIWFETGVMENPLLADGMMSFTPAPKPYRVSLSKSTCNLPTRSQSRADVTWGPDPELPHTNQEW